MILYNLLNLAISVLALVLAPFSMAANVFGNFLQDTGLIALLRFSTFFFNKSTLIYLITTLIFWFGLFVIKPLVDFIRNRS